MPDYVSLVSVTMDTIKGGSNYEDNQRARVFHYSMENLASAVRENTSAMRKNTSVLSGGIRVSGQVSTVSASV